MQSTAIPHGHDALAADGAIVRIREAACGAR